MIKFEVEDVVLGWNEDLQLAAAKGETGSPLIIASLLINVSGYYANFSIPFICKEYICNK